MILSSKLIIQNRYYIIDKPFSSSYHICVCTLGVWSWWWRRSQSQQSARITKLLSKYVTYHRTFSVSRSHLWNSFSVRPLPVWSYSTILQILFTWLKSLGTLPCAATPWEIAKLKCSEFSTLQNRQIKMQLKYSVLQYIVVTDVLLIIGLILIFQQVTPENCSKKQQEVKICISVAPPAKGWEMQDWFKHNQIYVQSCNMKYIYQYRTNVNILCSVEHGLQWMCWMASKTEVQTFEVQNTLEERKRWVYRNVSHIWWYDMVVS